MEFSKNCYRFVIVASSAKSPEEGGFLGYKFYNESDNILVLSVWDATFYWTTKSAARAFFANEMPEWQGSPLKWEVKKIYMSELEDVDDKSLNTI